MTNQLMNALIAEVAGGETEKRQHEALALELIELELRAVDAGQAEVMDGLSHAFVHCLLSHQTTCAKRGHG